MIHIYVKLAADAPFPYWRKKLLRSSKNSSVYLFFISHIWSTFQITAKLTNYVLWWNSLILAIFVITKSYSQQFFQLLSVLLYFVESDNLWLAVRCYYMFQMTLFTALSVYRRTKGRCWNYVNVAARSGVSWGHMQCPQNLTVDE